MSDGESISAGGEADSTGTDDAERLQVPDPGPIAKAAEATGRPAEGDQGPGPTGGGSLAERGRSDQGGLAEYSRQDDFPPVSPNVEVVGYSWTSPLPPAIELEGYDRIVPGSAERIISMAELAVRGPIENTAKVTDAEIEASKQGMTFAMVLTSVMSIAAIIFFALAVAGIGKTAALTAGGVCLSVPVVMLIRSFITRSLQTDIRRSRRRSGE